LASYEPDEISVTPAMIEAGVDAYFQFLGQEDSDWESIVRAVFVEMQRARLRIESGDRETSEFPAQHPSAVR
jgi:hypothetical protein